VESPLRRTVTRELNNGASLLVHPEPELPVVSVQLWCRTGSFHEGKWAGSGISHLLEHLIFKGSVRCSGLEFVTGLQDLGGHANAYTSFDRTVYHVDLPAENWKRALELLADAVLHPALPEAEFPLEKEVIRRELAMVADDPDAELVHLGLRTAFLVHPFRHPVIGTPDLFDALEHRDVVAYHRERYAPQNLFLVLSGAVQPEEAMEEAERTLGTEKQRAIPELCLPEEPAQMSPRRAQKEFPTEVSRVLFLFPIPGYEDPVAIPLLLLSLVAGGGKSSSFHRILVEEEGLAEDVEVFTQAALGAGVFGVEARCRPEKREALIGRIRELLGWLCSAAPTAEELDRAKRQALLQRWHSLKTASGRAAAVGWGWLLARDPCFYEAVVEAIRSTEAGALPEVAKRYLAPSRENLVELLPKGELSGKGVVEKGKSSAREVPPPEQELLLGQLRTIRRLDRRLPLVAVHAVFPGGVLWEREEQAGISRLAAQLLPKGTRKRQGKEIAATIEGLGGYLEGDAGNNSARLSLEVLREGWKEALRIFLEVLTEFQCREEELETERRTQLSLLAVEKEDPVAVARDLLRRTLFAGHPYERNPLGTRESLAQISPRDIEAFVHKVFFQERAVLGLAGDFLWEEFLAAAEAALEPWTKADSKAALSSVPPIPLGSGPVRVQEKLPKEQAVIVIGFPTPGLDHPWQIPLAVAAEALSDLGSRLFLRIRDQMGLAYFTGASRFLGLAGGWFSFYVGTDPARKEEVERVLWEEIQKLACEGLAEEEIRRAKTKLLSEDRIAQQDTAGVVHLCALHELVGLGYDYAWKRLQRIEALTREEVAQCLAECLGQKGSVTVVVSP
jgi:zinc protease